MIKSMTGYGRAQGSFSGGEITVEVKSVNNRYLDCGVKLPRGYAYLEEGVKSLVQKSISRGKVDVYITINSAGADNVKISVNGPVAAGYIEAMRSLVRDYGIQDDISVSAISQFNDVLLVEKQEQDENEVKTAISSVVQNALDAFDAMRTREGEALKADLLQKADGILTLVSSVEARSPITVAAYRERLTAKMREVLEERQIDEARIIQEAAIYADKVAVDEETVRLRSHVDQLKGMLNDGGVIGRKLDFLMQEMNREANTIGSKGNDVEQARNVVNIKSELEKIREQIQNIE
ncbi:MAG: YicC/YloC family endoribonuclease [Oscillospiraceae bacterium]|nr:YicC/YloC family endoribonuclease [Oscillospiraceae bacterium]